MSAADFSVKDRLRFRKLLEVAYSTTFSGERDAALTAAARLADAHGMTLHEAAGMKEPREEPQARPQTRPRGHAGFAADFGAAGPEAMGRWWARQTARGHGQNAGQNTRAQAADHAAATTAAREAAEKKRRDEALADAFRRGLDAEEIKARAKAEARASRPIRRPGNRGPWRSRPEFVRVLLAETRMSAKEIAAVAGVTIYDVFREKLLMRRNAA